MFRNQALQSVEQGTQYTHPPLVVGNVRWFLLAASGCAIISTLLWGFLARVPESVESMGILLYQTGVNQLHTLTSGQVLRVAVIRGQVVKPGDLIIELQTPQIDMELAVAQEKLRALEEVQSEQQAVAGDLLIEEERISSLKADSTQAAIQAIEALKHELRTMTAVGMKAQLQGVNDLINVWRSRLDELVQLRASVDSLLAEQLATRSDLSTIESQIVAAKQTLAQLEQQLQTLDTQRTESLQTDVDLTQRAKQLTMTEEEIGLSLKRFRMEQQAHNLRSQVQIESQRKLVEQLSAQKDQLRFIRASQAGQILELPVEVGQPVGVGSLVGLISRFPDDENQPLVLNGFFPLDSGKRIHVGQEAFITPTTLERERHGSIRGVISEQHAYPVSTEEALRIVGNRDLLAPLAGQGGMLSIKAVLDRDLQSGQYSWTSQDPGVDLTVGTTARVRVVVERRAPVSYVFPALRELIYGPEQPILSGVRR